MNYIIIKTESRRDIKAGIFQFICFIAYIIQFAKNEIEIYSTIPKIKISFISILLYFEHN